MELTIEQPCPTCGAAIILREDDRLVQCEYCDVHNYKVQQKLPRYILPSRLPRHVVEEELLYVPYLRFKGCIYYCQGQKVRHKIIDTTRVGTLLDSLPVSLGLRPQAMNVVPVTDQLRGKYVRQSVRAEKMFSEAARLATLFSKQRNAKVIHRAFIGETVSRVYLPVYEYKDILYDGVNHLTLGPGSLAQELAEGIISYTSDWEPRFLSTVCPGCGDTMHGSRDSLVMRCVNCESHWLEENGRFVELDYSVVPPLEGNATYIPFWQIVPEAMGSRLSSLADFLQLTNQPVVVQEKHREQKLAFLIPAFKINPATLLQIAKKLTISQQAFLHQERMALTECYPVTLAHNEAVQTLKSVLAASAVSSKEVMERLPGITFRVHHKKLLYLPFRETGHDCIQHHTGVSIATAALRFGRSL